MTQPVYKVIVLGSGGSGKTSLINRFVFGRANSDHISALPTAMLTKTVQTEGDNVTLQIWDWVGTDKYFEQIAKPGFLKGAQGAVLVYDCSSEDPSSALRAEELFRILQDVDSLRCIALAGNKCDKGFSRVVETVAARLLDRIRTGFDGRVFRVDTSSKDDIGVTDLFTKMASCLSTR